MSAVSHFSFCVRLENCSSWCSSGAPHTERRLQAAVLRGHEIAETVLPVPLVLTRLVQSGLVLFRMRLRLRPSRPKLDWFVSREIRFDCLFVATCGPASRVNFGHVSGDPLLSKYQVRFSQVSIWSLPVGAPRVSGVLSVAFASAREQQK